MTIGRFLAGIGALILNEAGDKYLVLKRSPEKDFAAGAWECVTGRVDQGESFEDALHREVREELQIAIRPLFIIGTTHFYRGFEAPENELLGVVYCCSSPDLQEMQLSHEHSAYRWLDAVEAEELLRDSHGSEHWLRKVIERAEISRRLYPMELQELHGLEGFELDS